MTSERRVTFDGRISLGHVLTAIGMAAALAVGWAEVQARQAAVDQQVHEISTTMSRIASSVDGNDLRIRGLERSDAVSTAHYDALAQSMAEVKSELRAQNTLLRQAIEGEKSR